jgi:hypothetical protein
VAVAAASGHRSCEHQGRGNHPANGRKHRPPGRRAPWARPQFAGRGGGPAELDVNVLASPHWYVYDTHLAHEWQRCPKKARTIKVRAVAAL